MSVRLGYRMKNIEECLAKIDRLGLKLRIIEMTSGSKQEFWLISRKNSDCR